MIITFTIVMVVWNVEVKDIVIIDDDLNDLARQIVSSDVIILGAPTYWANVPAIVKNLFDRMASYMIKDIKGRFPKPLLSKDQGYI